MDPSKPEQESEHPVLEIEQQEHLRKTSPQTSLSDMDDVFTHTLPARPPEVGEEAAVPDAKTPKQVPL